MRYLLLLLLTSCGSEFETRSELSSQPPLTVAKSLVGKPYWFGHALPTNSKSNVMCNRTGNSMIGGFDCSGFVGKVWGLADPFEKDIHPYSTADFFRNNRKWYGVNRDSVRKGDAFVKRSNGSGHIFIYDSGNVWGKAWSYEARGCNYGVVYNLRNVSSEYIAKTLIVHNVQY
jgi:hypothetical protein